MIRQGKLKNEEDQEPTYSSSAWGARRNWRRSMPLTPIPISTSSSSPRRSRERAAAAAWCRAASTWSSTRPDSHEKHLRDTLKGGQYINNQELAKTLVEQATPTIKEMETLYGCFFDRYPDGTVHQKPFAGQSFDRTVHKGDLTGIEIISRTTEQIMKRKIRVLEECRALDLLADATGREIAGALCLDINRGIFSSWKRRQRSWPRAAVPPVTGFSHRVPKRRWTAWACFTGPGCGWWTWRCSSSIRPG